MAEATAGAYYSGPLQLIQIDEDGKCHLQENAVAILNQIPGRLAVVGIAGLYRTGKSFLLNRLLGLQDGFEIGPSVNPCTKGLWIWGQPVQLAPDYYCILIDTEGLGSTQRSASCDMQILSLCILLSSYFIYNSIGAIDEQAIDELHLVLNLATHIHVKSRRKNEEEKRADLSQYFPIFLWVLRDFHLTLQDEEGAAITEKEYLERALRLVPGQEEKNQLREVIKELFRERDCVTIVRPVADEAELRNIQNVEYEKLRPQFRTQVEAFVKKVYTNLKPKKIDGAVVSGSMFVDLAAEYCKAINSSVVPTIHTAWASAIQHQLRLSLRDAVQAYRTKMNEHAMQHLPMSEDKLRDLHKVAKAEALKILLATKLDSDPRFRESRSQFATRVKQLFEHVRMENSNVSQRQCDKIARELFKSIEQKLQAKGTYQGFNDLLSDWEQLKQLYLQKSAGPSKLEVLSGWLNQQLLQAAQRLWEEFELAMEERKSQLRQQLAESEARMLQVKAPDEAQRQWLSERLDLERRLDEAKRNAESVSQKAAREKAQLLDSERTLREQMKIMQDRLNSERRVPALETTPSMASTTNSEIQNLKDSVVAMVSELRSKELQRNQMQLQVEHDKQMMSLERRFQKQLQEARSRSEQLLEKLRQSYDAEVDTLKRSQSELRDQNKDLEHKLSYAQQESKLLNRHLHESEEARRIQQRQVEVAQQQSQLLLGALERLGAGKDSDEKELLTAEDFLIWSKCQKN
ncbi:unnamed protein product [Cladocopium goreaui]|uniref:GB1/RHD3-type G domain-containing protein n=1 Tax=Cladocopium goreaui TaxID=2562237 RepID=A0A9P1BH16_9DINO|nr:unnamed protein product [Cladocopium goreaui]